MGVGCAQDAAPARLRPERPPLPRFTSGRTQAPHLPSLSARRPFQESDPGQRRMPPSSHPKQEKKKKRNQEDKSRASTATRLNGFQECEVLVLSCSNMQEVSVLRRSEK